MNLEEVLSKIPNYSKELGLNLEKREDRFKWFLASILFAKRISSDIAKRTFMRLVEEGLSTPNAIIRAGWDRLVNVLDSGGYVRYDFSTATNLLEIMKKLKKEYGDLENLHDKSSSPEDLERRLMEFKGIGPVCVNIFLRELRGIWKNARPKPCRIAVNVAKKIGLTDVEPYESQLVRIYLEYCKKKKCRDCPVRDFCKDKIS